MKQHTICMNCEAEVGQFSCLRCGRIVGKVCYDPSQKLCITCAQGMLA